MGPYGGIGASPKLVINNCYSTGTNLGTHIGNPIADVASFAILGVDTENCTVSNRVYNSYYRTTAGPTVNADTKEPLKNTYDNVIGTPNITGRATCNNPDTVQIIHTQYECQLHPKVLNPESYQKQNKNLNVVAAFSICKSMTICNILTFILKNVCRLEHLYIYSKDMKFKSPLQWDNNNIQYNGTLASGTYIIATKPLR